MALMVKASQLLIYNYYSRPKFYSSTDSLKPLLLQFCKRALVRRYQGWVVDHFDCHGGADFDSNRPRLFLYHLWKVSEKARILHHRLKFRVCKQHVSRLYDDVMQQKPWAAFIELFRLIVYLPPSFFSSLHCNIQHSIIERTLLLRNNKKWTIKFGKMSIRDPIWIRLNVLSSNFSVGQNFNCFITSFEKLSC